MDQATAPVIAFGTQAQFADAQDWTRGYVSRLKKEDRLVFNAEGLVDFVASLARIKGTSGAVERAAPVVQGQVYNDSQDRDRHYSAELKRLEYERETRKLFPADEVRSAVKDAATTIRVTVEGWRNRMPAQLAACGADEQRLAECLAYECDSLLRRMHDDLGEIAR